MSKFWHFFSRRQLSIFLNLFSENYSPILTRFRNKNCHLLLHSISKTASQTLIPVFWGGRLSSEPRLTAELGADFLSSWIPFFRALQFVVECWISTMEILSALKSWSSSKEKLAAACKFESPNLRSPRFRRWGSKKQRTSNRKLPTCRENRASSNSVPSSLFGDSCSDLSSVRINTFRSEDYLDPFQGKTAQRVKVLIEFLMW